MEIEIKACKLPRVGYDITIKNFCCTFMKNAINESYIMSDSPEDDLILNQAAHSFINRLALRIVSYYPEDHDYNEDFMNINYCPFCGKFIEYKEIAE